MLDPGRTPDPETGPEPAGPNGPGQDGLWRVPQSVRRRLVVIGICAAVSLATVAAVQRPVGQNSPSQSSTSVEARGEVLRSGSRVPTLEESKNAGTQDDLAEGSGNGNQVPARPADALGGLLDARATAMRDGDRAAWMAGLAPSSTVRVNRFRTAQGRLFDRVRSLRPVSWSYQVAGGYGLPPERRAELGGVAWLAEVQLNYQLTSGGPTVRRQQFLTIVRHAGTWLIADDTDGSTARDVWDLGPIAHAVSARCLVVGAQARRVQIEQLAAECTGPAGTVDGAWGRTWPRHTVLTVPDTLPQLAVLLGRTSTGSNVDVAGLEQTAAVTIGPSDAAADTVLINSAAFDELNAVGRRVVLTHELVHVATRATGSRSAPTWLAEGYADYVAYAGTGLSARQVAAEALDAVRAGRMPTRLPAADDFNAAGDQAAASYGLSWVAAELIAVEAGDAQRMKAFYQQAAAADADAVSLDAALAVIGLGDTTAFVKVWQTRLRQLAQS